jgi:uncharacterized protein GlcG (DUF336 family)
MRVRLVLYTALLALFVSMAASGSDEILAIKRMSAALARDIAQHALEACQGKGYQVTAVVVDRDGIPQAMTRDVYASRFTIQIAREKANAVVLSGVASGEFRRNRADIREEMNHVNGVLMLQGALPIRVGGALVGALGVSGAPGGDKDEECARAALDAVRERLEFAQF